MCDLGRLQRRWAKRLATDAELAKQAAELAKTKPNAVPKVSAAKGVLKPFPWSKRGAPVQAPAAAMSAETAVEEGDFDLGQYAALAAELAIAPGDRERVIRRHGILAPALVALQARWDARMAADSALAQDYRRLFAHHRARFESAAKSGKALPRVEAREPLHGPELAPHPDLRTMPIDAQEASIDAAMPPRRAPSKLAGTAMAVDVPRGPALPFTKGIAPKEIAESDHDVSRPKRSSLGGTAMAVDVPRGPATPFAAENKAISSTTPDREPPRRAPSKLAGTAMAVDVPRGPALPFDPTAAVALAIEAKLPPAPPAPAGLGGTSLLLDIPRGAALPFARRDPRAIEAEFKAEASPPEPIAVTPKKKLGELKFGMVMPKNLPPARGSYAPPLTLEQHASLTVDIAVAPDRVAETLGCYHLTAAARAELDAHYRAKIAASAETRAAWDRAHQAYFTGLAANRRPAR